jgi:tyrosinase
MTNAEGNDTNRRESAIRPQVYVSKEIYIDITKLENEFYRADIEIAGVDHSGSSYEGRVFLNNPYANQKTDLTLENGYVGSYHIFGHGGCFGGMGHCDIPTEPRRTSDYRPSHHLRPQYKRIIITDAFKKLGKNTNKFTITIVPVLYGGSQSPQSETKEIIKFDRIGIITYD